MIRLKIIVASTRPQRHGPSIASWITTAVQNHTEFAVEVLDLAVINLPFLDEPQHPRLRTYQQEHTKKWSAVIESSDAFIIVTPEYNFSFPAPLKNALDFLYHEWSYKPVAFVTYGGLSAGTRSLQMLKLVVTTLKMMPMVEAVNIPFFTKHIDEQKIFHPTEELEQSAEKMFKELLTWANGLKAMREAGEPVSA